MRILVVSNLYPPFSLTGYELGCRDIVESLKSRGHAVRVLTARDCFVEDYVEDDVHRRLMAVFRGKLDWRSAVLKELVNQTAFKRICSDFEPEVVFFFNLSRVSTSLGLLAREMGLPVCTYLSNDWFAVWEKDPWSAVWPREKGGSQVLRFMSRRFGLLPPSELLHFGQAMFSNGYLKDLAVRLNRPMSQATVIPWGVDIDRFPYKKDTDQKPGRLLVAGATLPSKCIGTAVKALAVLKRDFGCEGLSLTIIGDDPFDPTLTKSLYLQYLRNLAGELDVRDDVRFLRGTARENMPAVYHSHDILIDSSGDEGASSLSLLEAMSSGLAVVGRLTAGKSDLLKDEDNALVFPDEDSGRCARQVLRLVDNPGFYDALRANARKAIERGFRIETSVDAIERVLEAAAGNRPSVRTEKSILLGDKFPGESLDRLARRAKKLLRWGAIAVTARTVTRPRFFIKKGQKLFYKMVSVSALMILPVFYEAFFRLAGRRPKVSKTGVRRIKSVLVVQPADMGDVLLSGPFLRELRKNLPDAWIGLAILPSMFELVEKCPYVDEVIAFPWRSFSNWGTAFTGHVRWWLRSTLMTIQTLWKRRIDLAVSLRWNNDAPQAAALTLMYVCGAPKRAGYVDLPRDRIPYKPTDINRLITQGPIRTFLKHEVEFQAEILSSLGMKASSSEVEVWTGQEDEDFAADVLRRAGLSGNDLLVAFAPGAAWSFRRWPAERFIALGRRLQESHGARIVILAAGNERSLAGRIERGLRSGRTLNLAGRTTIRQMAAVFRRCRLFVGSDSGPLHLAAGVGVPVVGLYGPGEYERFRPWGSNHEAIRLGLSCSPCSQSCAFDDPRCIKGISLEQVEDVVSRKLESPL